MKTCQTYSAFSHYATSTWNFICQNFSNVPSIFFFDNFFVFPLLKTQRRKTFRLYISPNRRHTCKITCTSLTPTKANISEKVHFFIYNCTTILSSQSLWKRRLFRVSLAPNKSFACCRLSLSNLAEIYFLLFWRKIALIKHSFDSILCNISKFNGKFSFAMCVKCVHTHINISGRKKKHSQNTRKKSARENRRIEKMQLHFGPRQQCSVYACV